MDSIDSESAADAGAGRWAFAALLGGNIALSLGAMLVRMAEADISLESIVQRRSPEAATRDPGGRSGAPVPVVLITYATSETTIRAALEKVTADGHVAEPPQVIRIEREQA